MNKRGAILCIIDGLTDESFDASTYPHLSAIRARGAYGAFATVPPGFMAESYPCIASLLGVPAAQLPPHARGYMEALGAGIAVGRDDLILRASWMRLDERDNLLGPAPPGLPPCAPGCAYHALDGYRALLVLHGAAAALPQVVTYPPHACAGQPLATVLPQGEPRLAELVRRSRDGDRVLIPWGQSAACAALPAFPVRAALVGAALVVRGLALAMGLDVFNRPGFSGDIDSGIIVKTSLTLALAGQYPLVVLHINGADEAAHRRDAVAKHNFLRRVDDAVIAGLKRSGGPVLICCDHGSSPLSGCHLGGEQPFWLDGGHKRGNLGLLPAQAATTLLLEG